jgi:cell division protein ZapA
MAAEAFESGGSMSQVNVTISGKLYRMACDDGQEEHLMGLAEEVNGLIEEFRGNFGEIGDQRLTMMAAITLADRRAEADRLVQRLQAELASAEETRAADAERFENAQFGLARAVDVAAQQIEAVAKRIGAHGGDAGEGEAA